MKNNNLAILLTGGHAGSTAFEVIREIRRQKKDWQINWIGFKTSVEGKKIPPLSEIYFPQYNVKTYSLYAGKLQRKFTRHTIPSILKIPLGFIHSYSLLLKIRPKLILSFGGFTAFPVVFGGWLLRIPIIIHEQTTVAGLTNRLSAPFAKIVAISRESSQDFFPKKKTIITGNPTPKDVFSSEEPNKISDLPLIFVTGGQSGSSFINDIIGQTLRLLLEKYTLVHLTGLKDEEKYKKLRDELPDSIKKKYQIYGIVDPEKYNQLFVTATVVVSRAGANTVSKLIAAKKPSILIPLPISYMQEQQKNAEFARDFGLAKIIPQDHLSGDKLISTLDVLISNRENMIKKVLSKESPDKDASTKVVELMSKLI